MVAAPIILAMIAIEVAVSLWRGRGFFEWNDTWGSLGMLVGNALMGVGKAEQVKPSDQVRAVLGWGV